MGEKLTMSIEAYMQIYKKYPEYFKQDGDIQLVLEKATLLKYAEEYNYELGLLYENNYFWIINDLVENSSRCFPYMRVIHKVESNGVVIIPRIGDKIVFLRQFRHGTRQLELELPRGFAEEGQTVYENAARELFEEVGTQAKNIELLGSIISDSALTYGPVYILSCDIERVGNLDQDEGIKDTVLLTESEAIDYIRTDNIRDSFSICAMMKMIAHTKGG